jgi:hypothetical protein
VHPIRAFPMGADEAAAQAQLAVTVATLGAAGLWVAFGGADAALSSEHEVRMAG